MLETFLVKTKLLMWIHLQQVNFWEGERDVAKMLEVLGAGPRQALLAAYSQLGTVNASFVQSYPVPAINLCHCIFLPIQISRSAMFICISDYSVILD